MTDGKLQLHGTHFESKLPIIDREIDTIPPAFRVPNTEEVLQFAVIDYNRIQLGDEKIALGILAVRMLNSFFFTDPQRNGSVLTAEIIKVWKKYGIDEKHNLVGPVLRGVDALNAIRQEIDGRLFITGGSNGSGYPNHYAISDDIIFDELR